MPQDTAEARTTRRLAASPEQVFDAWLDPELIRAWMPRSLERAGLPGDVRRVETDPRVGGRFTFSDVRDEGEAVHWGTYRTLDRPRTLAFGWFTSDDEERQDLSTVTLTLAPTADGGTTATMVHEMAARWAAHADRVAAAWDGMLAAIDAMWAARTGT